MVSLDEEEVNERMTEMDTDGDKLVRNRDLNEISRNRQSLIDNPDGPWGFDFIA